MATGAKVVALKEEGTHPPSEGMLAEFAEVREIRSGADAISVAGRLPDLVLLDMCMPTLDAESIVEAIKEKHSSTVIILVNFQQSPNKLRVQLSKLATGVLPKGSGKLSVLGIARTLGISQEGLSRMVNVSAKTAHRWIKGAKPRPNIGLQRLAQVVSLLKETFPSGDAIQDYLNHPNPSFDGKTPRDVLIAGDYHRIVGDLQALREGVYI
jgi:CheY-like chemotaxis protein